MQEGWHYEFDGEDAQPYYNGVVYSEMKGAYADVDQHHRRRDRPSALPGQLLRLSPAAASPEHIPELTYEQFVAAPPPVLPPLQFANSSRWTVTMDIDAMLHYIDGRIPVANTTTAPRTLTLCRRSP